MYLNHNLALLSTRKMKSLCTVIVGAIITLSPRTNISHYALIFLTKTKKIASIRASTHAHSRNIQQTCNFFEHNLKTVSQRRYKMPTFPILHSLQLPSSHLIHSPSDLVQAAPRSKSLPLGTPTRMSSSDQPNQAPSPNQTSSPQDDEHIGLSSFGEPPHDGDLAAINNVDSEMIRLLSTNNQTNSVLAGLMGGTKRVFEWFKGIVSKISWNGLKEGFNEIIGRFDILNWFKGVSRKIDCHDILEWFKQKRKSLACSVFLREGINLTVPRYERYASGVWYHIWCCHSFRRGSWVWGSGNRGRSADTIVGFLSDNLCELIETAQAPLRRLSNLSLTVASRLLEVSSLACNLWVCWGLCWLWALV